MSAEDCAFLLSESFDRAMNAASPGERCGIRRAFRRAARMAANGDARPTILLSYRYP